MRCGEEEEEEEEEIIVNCLCHKMIIIDTSKNSDGSEVRTVMTFYDSSSVDIQMIKCVSMFDFLVQTGTTVYN